ncbi:MAG: hypothetical protein R2706_12525 [Acidimicrobiales bacterium]
MGTVIGICGGSGSGKSTLATRVAGAIAPTPVSVLQFDSYYRDHGHLSPDDRALVNYDHPDSLDVELFVAHLDALRRAAGTDPGLRLQHPTRSDEVRWLEPAPVIVAEGILLLAFAQIRERFHLAVFRECPEDIRLARTDATRHRRAWSNRRIGSRTICDDRRADARSVCRALRGHADLVVKHNEIDLDEAARLVVVQLATLSS